MVPQLQQNSPPTVRARWQIGLTMLLLAVALLWPAAINQRPSYFFDSVGYLSNGDKALTLFTSRVEARLGSHAAVSTVAAAPEAPGKVVSLRAIAYSLFTALLAAPGHSLWLVIIANALIVVLLVWEFWRLRAPEATPRDEAIAAAFVAFGTSAPWFVSYAMPDVLAGAALLGLAVLTFTERQHFVARLLVAAVVAFAVAAHASHIPIIGLITAAALTEIGYEHWRGIARWSWSRAFWVVLPLVTGVGLVMALSLVGFGSVSVAPKRLPFALARSIDDGPGKWYLEATCAQKRWAVCPFFEATGHLGPELLFSKNGLMETATPAQMEAVRAEEMTIVRAATVAYPWVQIKAAAMNSVQQFFRFGLADNSFAYTIVRKADGSFGMHRGVEPFDVRPAAAVMIYAGIVLALLYLLSILRGLSFAEAGTLRLVFAGLVVNAMVTGTLSGLTDRYQSRIIWVVPVVALGLWLARRSPTRTAKGSADAA